MLDTGQTGSRVRLHNSWVDSYGPAIYDWVAFMSIEGGGSRQKENGKKKYFGLKEIFLPLIP